MRYNNKLKGDARHQNDISRDEVAAIFFRMLTDNSRNGFG